MPNPVCRMRPVNEFSFLYFSLISVITSFLYKFSLDLFLVSCADFLKNILFILVF